MMSRRWSIPTVALAAALSLAAAGGATATSDPVGAWFSDECIVQINFRADGTFAQDDAAGSYGGTWRLDGTTLSMTYSDDGKTESGTFTDGELRLAGCVFKRT